MSVFFRPFDKVIYRAKNCNIFWKTGTVSLVYGTSIWIDGTQCDLLVYDVLPYEGNEDLAWTINDYIEPLINVGDKAVFSDKIPILKDGEGSIGYLEKINATHFNKRCGADWRYCIPYSDYVKVTDGNYSKYILEVENFKVKKYE